MTRRHTVPGIPASPCWQRPMQTKPWSRRLWDTPVPWRSLNVSTPTWILKHWWRQSTRSKRKKEKPCSTKKQEIRSLRNDLLLHKAFVFACDSCSLCAPCLLLTKQNGTLLRNSHNSKSIQFSAKQRPKTHWEAVEIISWVSEISACWTLRAWCWPRQISGDFFAFRLIFGLILQFFCTSDSNFYPRAWRTKSRFCSLCVPCVSLPRATQDNSKERNLVAVLGVTSIFETSESHKLAG